MVDVKIVVISVVIVLSVCLQPGIRANPTNGSSSEDDSCLLLEEELEFQRVVNRRLRNTLKSKQQKINTLENKRRRLTTVKTLGIERPRLTTIKTPQSELSTLGPRQAQPVTATEIHSFEPGLNEGITKVDDRIYVLCTYLKTFKVYQDRNGLSLISEIMLNNTPLCDDIVYSNKSKCIYMKDFITGSIWVMTTTDEHRVNKWLPAITESYSPYRTISLSNEGHMLVTRSGASFNQYRAILEIYALNATLIRRLYLPRDIEDPIHVVQTSAGDFIIGHQLNNTNGPCVISKLTNDGQLIQRFIPKNQSENSFVPAYLCLDSENNRLFVADPFNKRVVLFDSSDLTWIQVLVSPEMNGILQPKRLFYDASKNHLFIGLSSYFASVYEIN